MSSPATLIRDLTAGLESAGVQVDSSSRARAEYSSDASLYRVVPQAVAFPRSADDVEAALSVCRSLRVPVTPRGGGTSIAGNAVGPGLVLDFSRHMHRVVALDPEAATAVVQPGVVLDYLQRAAAPHGLRFGPDPSTHNRCTLGGVIGNNSCGSRSLGYGRPSDNVVALDVLTGAGERITARAQADPASSPAVRALADVVRDNLAVIRTEFGRFGRQVSGYSLEHLLPEHAFDVARALVGTEGTLGVLTGATVRLARAPRVTTLLALGYPDMASAADAAPAIRRHGPKAIEGLDARIVDVVLRRRGPAFVPDLPRGAGWLLVELGGDTAAEVADLAGRVAADAGALDARVVTDRGETAQLWRIREDGAGLASRPAGGRFFHAGWEDAAVPTERLGAYLRDFDALLVERGLVGLPYGHFGEGCVHVRIDFPLSEPGGVGVFREFLLDAARLVASHGGSMSGEHGDGRARSELLPLMYSPAALAAFAAVKRAFDPEGLLNPGVLVDPAPATADLRAPGARPVRRGLALAYDDDDGDFANAVHRCTGVGKCRADITGSGGVMCPSFLATRQEKDSTRGRARVLQEMVNGRQVRGGWRSPEVHQVLDLCLQCKGCAVDCPTGVDMASYKAEVLHQSYKRRPRPRTHYSLGWLPRWARLASRAPRLTNRLLRLGPSAALGKRLAGIDPRRPLPQFAERTFRDWFAGRPESAPGDPVVLWVDTWTNHFTPQVGAAAVEVLESAGFSVRIPDEPVCCGLTWISTGQLDAAKKQLQRSVDALAPAAEAGVPIVGLEPSCTAVFRGDAEELLGPDAPGVRAVASATGTLAELLTSREGWRPPDLSGVHGVAQPHCHQHAVMGFGADAELLRRGGASVTAVGGCCGLAGNFGAERGHFDVSVAVAETALLPAVRAAGENAVILTDGFSCRTQLTHLGDRQGRHLAELLAEAGRSKQVDDTMTWHAE
ncbi:FAD-binding oxidoreductase [Geodermatophilus sp. DF01-2]|uniref:FAD-binding and (Fe-S)-binding domain-containing protein n=1 Tax=Geodermatophilus sp. DF01-2 TaxID=2559610 RepID=UPI001072EEB9|nr:FAD-binding and (Fe-S)-binding domain-containing protein [Geodermatophilus sp. DF01_2]TFV60873.1 FAD-binding oxidoreductase [Geodermatophilus sp. DF01_2]